METTLRRRLRAKLFLASAHPARERRRAVSQGGPLFLGPCPARGQCDPAVKLRRRDLEGLRDKLMVRYKPNTLAAALSPLAAALTWAMRQELIPLADGRFEAAAQDLQHGSSERQKRGDCRNSRDRSAPMRCGKPATWRSVWPCALGCASVKSLVCAGDIELPRRRVTVACSFDRTPKSGEPRTVPLPAPWSTSLHNGGRALPHFSGHLKR